MFPVIASGYLPQCQLSVKMPAVEAVGIVTLVSSLLLKLFSFLHLYMVRALSLAFYLLMFSMYTLNQTYQNRIQKKKKVTKQNKPQGHNFSLYKLTVAFLKLKKLRLLQDSVYPSIHSSIHPSINILSSILKFLSLFLVKSTTNSPVEFVEHLTLLESFSLLGG